MKEVKGMNPNKVPFNYFYITCQKKYKLILFENMRSKLQNNTNKDLDYFEIQFQKFYHMTLEEKVSMMKKAIWETCVEYISLSNTPIEVIPNDAFELLQMILDMITENSYQESFLQSVQFICRDYLEILGKGSPILFSSEDKDKESTFLITLDSKNKLNQFEAINMTLLEQTKTMVNICTMETNKELGPIPKVLYRIRKDI